MIQRAHKRPKIEVSSYKGKQFSLWVKAFLALVLAGALVFALQKSGALGTMRGALEH